ncbi:MAG: AAA family ATPase [Gammaproteobacteria bacterium]|nr:AAA family ATPase [Gammaproteobacteria bacterium]
MFADYHEQRQAFTKLFEPDCVKRIMLFKGESGSGKSMLLDDCLKNIPSNLCNITIDLSADRAVGIAEIFSRFVRVLKHERLPVFHTALESLNKQAVPGGVRMDTISQKGSNNQINVALSATAKTDRDECRVALTDAWFRDIENLAGPLLLILDTYEQAQNEVKQWISGPFLARTAEVHNVRVAAAGQEIPKTSIEWKRCCAEYHLKGIHEAKHWLPVAQKMGCCAPPKQDLYSCIATACTIYQGHPANIMKFIKTLPRYEC